MSAIAAIIIRREKDLVALFRQAKAVSAETAQPLSRLGASDDVALKRLRRRAVVREAGPDRFYLDEPSWAAVTMLRRRMTLVVFGLALAILAILAVATWRSQPH